MKRREKGQKREKATEKEMTSFMDKGAENMAGKWKQKGSKSKKGSGVAKPC